MAIHGQGSKAKLWEEEAYVIHSLGLSEKVFWLLVPDSLKSLPAGEVFVCALRKVGSYLFTPYFIFGQMAAFAV